MKPTEAQLVAIAHLSSRFGAPIAVRYEATPNDLQDEGIVWLHWLHDQTTWGRNLFIRPDGERMGWYSVES